MKGGRALRAGALVALALGAFGAAAPACSPLELDLTEGDAGPDSSTPDATVPGDATVRDAHSEADAPPAPDGPSREAGVDADAAVPPLSCSTTADCPDSGIKTLCNVDAGVCVECLSASDCVHANASQCIGNMCIACVTNADCNDGGTDGGMVCNTFIPRCASACSNTTNPCTQSMLPCNQSNGYCVDCLDDSYCLTKPTGRHCYVAAGVCGCQSSADCPSAQTPNCGPASPTGNRFCQQ
jgi:hypothetical protein